jgi:acylaminoacyl-peptidase
LLFDISPVSFIHGKVSPCLLMLGNDDRRVPPSQGRRWAEAVRSAGNEVTTVVFNDVGHALDSFESEWHGFEISSAFFLKHAGTGIDK